MALGFILIALKRRKSPVEHKRDKSSGARANETDLYFLLTTGHAASLAANIFGSSSLVVSAALGRGAARSRGLPVAGDCCEE